MEKRFFRMPQAWAKFHNDWTEVYGFHEVGYRRIKEVMPFVPDMICGFNLDEKRKIFLLEYCQLDLGIRNGLKYYLMTVPQTGQLYVTIHVQGNPNLVLADRLIKKQECKYARNTAKRIRLVKDRCQLQGKGVRPKVN